MARLTIDTGILGNTATGDTLRTAMTKINTNFEEVYQLVGDGSTGLITTAITNGDLKLQANGTGAIEIDTLSITNSTITSITTNSDITLTPNGTGNVVLGNFTFNADQTVGAAQDNYVFTYDHSTGTIGLESASGGSATFTFVGDDSTGTAVTQGETFKFAGTQNITTAVSGDTLTITGPDLTNYLQNTGTQTIDNLTFNDNIIGTSSNADLELTPGGTGAVKVTQKLVLDTSQNDGSTVTIDATKPVAILAGNTGADDLEYTLEDGTVAGQTIMLVRGNNPDGNNRSSIHVIFGKFNDDGTITTNANKEIFSQYQSVVTCIWNGSAWCTDKHQN